jgi:hypothetical protein
MAAKLNRTQPTQGQRVTASLVEAHGLFEARFCRWSFDARPLKTSMAAKELVIEYRKAVRISV